MNLPRQAFFGLALLLALRTTAHPAFGDGPIGNRGSGVDLRYTISMEEPATHRFHIIFRCAGISGPVLDLKMPAWMPGFYQLLDYAGKVEKFHAVDGSGRELGWEKTTSNSWRVEHPPGTAVTVTYDIAATKSFVAQPWLDSTRGYIAPAGVFFYIDGYLQQPVTVEVKPWAGWNKVATGLEAVAGEKYVFRAPDFDVLYV
jgi:predicted metalloprotease with PDZ domain